MELKDLFGKKLGFGAMRPPMIGFEPDYEQVQKMVDAFMNDGFNYFDTAHVYLDGKSEEMLRKCLTSKYPRESFILTDKLSGTTFHSEGGVKPVICSQLKACGVSYFDILLMHAQGAINYPKFRRCRAYEQAFELKAEGKVRHVGISFHDQPEVLEKILLDYPEIEVVQLQFNYLDYDSASVRSKDCYDACVRFGKPVIVMEPVKGGHLACVPDSAVSVASSVGCSPSELAIRFAAGFENVAVVLSGMSSIEQLEENIGFMKNFRPLSVSELAAVEKMKASILSSDQIQCTGCRYCVSGCPQNILIPNLIADFNDYKLYKDHHSGFYYNSVNTVGHGLASDCIKCGKCEVSCPQHLDIRSILTEIASVFEHRS